MNKVLKSLLEKTRLKGCPTDGCDKTATEMSYDELVTHLHKYCSRVVVQCPLACGQTFRREAWSLHFDEECPKV